MAAPYQSKLDNPAPSRLGPQTPRLDAQAAMQNRPIGTNTAFYRDPAEQAVGRDYRRTKEEYGRARRLLKKYAGAGDADSALKLLQLRRDARAEGIQLGGTTQANENAGNIANRTRMLKGDLAAKQGALVAMDEGQAARTGKTVVPETVDKAPMVNDLPSVTEPVRATRPTRLGQMASDRRSDRFREMTTMPGNPATGGGFSQGDLARRRQSWWSPQRR